MTPKQNHVIRLNFPGQQNQQEIYLILKFFFADTQTTRAETIKFMFVCVTLKYGP